MSLVAVCADKGSPGVTTTTLALAVTWPRPAIAAELDPSGGDLALRLTDSRGRHELAAGPNLLTLAAATRRGGGPRLALEHCQATSVGVPVLIGPASAEQSGGLTPVWPDIARALLRAEGRDVLADLGRLLPGSPAQPVVEAADLVVLVTQATVGGLIHARDRAHALERALRDDASIAVIVVAGERDGPDAVRACAEILAAAGVAVRVTGFVALDWPRAVSRSARCTT